MGESTSLSANNNKKKLSLLVAVMVVMATVVIEGLLTFVTLANLHVFVHS